MRTGWYDRLLEDKKHTGTMLVVCLVMVLGFGWLEHSEERNVYQRGLVEYRISMQAGAWENAAYLAKKYHLNVGLVHDVAHRALDKCLQGGDIGEKLEPEFGHCMAIVDDYGLDTTDNFWHEYVADRWQADEQLRGCHSDSLQIVEKYLPDHLQEAVKQKIDTCLFECQEATVRHLAKQYHLEEALESDVAKQMFERCR